MKVAAVQMTSGRDVERNLADARRLLAEAAAAGAELIVLPENFSFLGAQDAERIAAAEAPGDGPAQTFLVDEARRHRAWIVGGTIPIRDRNDRAASRSYLVSPEGEIAAFYDKIHLFDVDLGPGQVYRESKRFVAGERSCLVALDGYRLGLSVCYDLRFPELYRNLARRGAELLSVPSAFTVPTGEAHWHVLLRARAIETGCFVLAPAQHGRHEDGSETYGHTLVVDPWGRVIAERPADPGVLLATLDLDEVGRCRARLPSLRHDRPWAPEDC